MRKVALTLLILFILVVIGIMAGYQELRNIERETTTVPESTTELVTETTTETTTLFELYTKETTTENYPEIYTEKENGMVFYNEQGELTNYMGTFYITGYTAEEGFYEGKQTASGEGVRLGICAMNDKQRKELGIEWGDSIYIDGLGTYQVYDNGCDYGVIDIWWRTDENAYRYTGYYDVYR